MGEMCGNDCAGTRMPYYGRSDQRHNIETGGPSVPVVEDRITRWVAYYFRAGLAALHDFSRSGAAFCDVALSDGLLGGPCFGDRFHPPGCRLAVERRGHLGRSTAHRAVRGDADLVHCLPHSAFQNGPNRLRTGSPDRA